MTVLHWIGETIRSQLMLVPLAVAKWLFLGLLLLLMGWIVQLDESVATPPDRQGNWYEDLRIWAWIAVMFQIVVYSVF